jgi:hypothetical protein
MNIISSFIALKYQLPTDDNFQRDNLPKCQELLDTYPGEVVSNWAWRCAEDVEHLATTPESKEVYRIARLFRAGKAAKEELDKAWSAATAAANVTAAAWTVYYAAYTAYYAGIAAAYHAAYLVAFAAYAASTADDNAKDRDIKWALYRTWLIEGLCEYEGKL